MRVGRVILLLAAISLVSLPTLGGTDAGQDEFRSLLEQGFQFHRQQQYAEALPLLQRAWQLNPRDHAVNLLLGIDLLHTGKSAEAIPHLQAASRAQPGDEFAYEYLGQAEAGLRHYAKAAAAYRKAVQVAPQSSQAAIAFVDFSLERFRDLAQQLRSSPRGLAAEYRLEAMAHPLSGAEREKLLAHAAASDPDAPGIWSELALSRIALNKRQEALQDLGRAKARNAVDLRAWEAEALLAAEAGNWSAAAAKLNAIARHSPAMLVRAAADWPPHLRPPDPVSGAAADFFQCVEEKSGSCNTMAFRRRAARFEERTAASDTVLFKQQRWERLAGLSAPAPQEKQQWYFRGAALAHMGDFASATPALERSLGMQRQPVHGLFLLSWCYARQAGEIAKHIEQTGADPALAHVMRGDVLLRLQGNSEQAIAEYRSALAASPNDLSILERLAEAQLSAGHLEDARKTAQTVLKKDSRRMPAKRTLVEVAMRERDYKAALPYLRELVTTNPADLSARAELGTACARTGSLKEALQNLTFALERGYPDPKGSLHYLLGTVLRRLGRSSEAARAFNTARELSDASEARSRQERNAQP